MVVCSGDKSVRGARNFPTSEIKAIYPAFSQHSSLLLRQLQKGERQVFWWLRSLLRTQTPRKTSHLKICSVSRHLVSSCAQGEGGRVVWGSPQSPFLGSLAAHAPSPLFAGSDLCKQCGHFCSALFIYHKLCSPPWRWHTREKRSGWSRRKKKVYWTAHYELLQSNMQVREMLIFFLFTLFSQPCRRSRSLNFPPKKS